MPENIIPVYGLHKNFIFKLNLFFIESKVLFICLFIFTLQYSLKWDKICKNFPSTLKLVNKIHHFMCCFVKIGVFFYLLKTQDI